MFTGIVQAVGTVRQMSTYGQDRRLLVEPGALDLSGLRQGDSLAVDGCCLTLVSITASGFTVDVSDETLARTTLGELTAGNPVNLEPALALGSALGGHLVSGHVDGTAEILWRRPAGRCERWRLRSPQRLARYIAEKGSACLAGVSLTVNAVAGAEFEVTLVPHTLEVTTLGARPPGARMNLEVDLIARYLERLMPGNAAVVSAGGEDVIRAESAGHGAHEPQGGGGNHDEAQGAP
ncbi:MAG TPA: riboflavin synthase [Nitrococcus sp.]|nr:riboflavin synthase [Nitrococcus sp.]